MVLTHRRLQGEGKSRLPGKSSKIVLHVMGFILLVEGLFVHLGSIVLLMGALFTMYKVMMIFFLRGLFSCVRSSFSVWKGLFLDLPPFVENFACTHVATSLVLQLNKYVINGFCMYVRRPGGGGRGVTNVDVLFSLFSRINNYTLL